jgi:hypothetical protein
MKRSSSTLWSLVTILPFSFAVLAGCGGGKPADSADSAESADSSESSEKTDSASEASTDKGEPEGEKADDSKDEAKEEKKADKKADEPKAAEGTDSPGPTAPRTPKDIVTAPDVLFMFSFNDSDMKKDAEEKCEKSSKGDGKKNADCMAKARKKVDHDGMGFAQDKSGGWVWTTIKRNGNVLVTLHKVPIEFGEETKNSITIKTTGKDTGKKPKTPPAKLVLEVPNDYQIAVKDASSGRMVYEAKIGIVGEQGQKPAR